ncbi:hypothetical protein [Legionella steigerwaltii]|uniref:hypothetical protein n=1 Tax=Legionella steigerwaltii TaxID=460 RepID=UPI000730EFD9|nr:hypothetical protein [Legionella steigerwaltii]
MRTYSKNDLTKIISKLNNNNFDWEIKTIPTTLIPINITYLIGQPQTHQPSNSSSSERKRIRKEYTQVKPVNRTSASVCIALGILSGFFAFLMSREPRITIAISLLTAILCWTTPNSVNTKIQQYGRFFRSFSTENKVINILENALQTKQQDCKHEL